MKISDLDKANSLQRDRQTLQKTLKIIDVQGKGKPAKWNLAELDEQLQKALRALPLHTSVATDDVYGLASILQGAASDAGFNVGTSGYLLKASLMANEPIKKDDWYWLRSTLKLEFIAQDGVTVLGYESWPLKVSAGASSQLRSRMRKAADKKLKTELFNSMLKFAS